MRRSLSYFWRIHLAVVLGSAVATSILTGALLVGDSVRGSLRDLSLDRLGRIEFALQSERFFREDLAGDLSSAVGFAESFESAIPAILLSGSVRNANTQARASRVRVQGVDERLRRRRAWDLAGERIAYHEGRQSNKVTEIVRPERKCDTS